jgi:hypothetical protein
MQTQMTWPQHASALDDNGHCAKGDMDEYHQERHEAVAFANGRAGVQVIGKRNKEEELLGVAMMVDKALKTYRRGIAQYVTCGVKSPREVRQCGTCAWNAS